MKKFALMILMVFSLGSKLLLSAEAAPLEADTASEKPHLVLHFDINKTVILLDPVSGQTAENILQSALSECTWGRVVESEAGKKTWELAHAEPSSEKPAAGLVTYSDFLEYGLFKLMGVPEGGESEEEKALRKAENKKRKKEKKTYKKKFTYEGEPGQVLHPYYEKLQEALSLSEGESTLFEGRDYYFVLPSFFKLINHLLETDRSFSIVFRTFGTDVEEVTKEFYAFLQGNHPLASVNPLFKCVKPDPNLRIAQNSFGSFHSTDIVVESEIDREIVNKTVRKTVLKRELFAESSQKRMRIWEHSGDERIYNFMKVSSSFGIHLGITDDYEYWAHHGEDPSAGKLHLVDSDDTSMHSIFFDDNIERTHTHIVDVHDRSKGYAPVSFEEAINRWMVRADPIQALLNLNFFVEALQVCEENNQAEE